MKNETCSIHTNKFTRRTSVMGKKTVHFGSKRAHNPETLECIKKKHNTVRDFTTEDCGKLSNLKNFLT